MKVILLSLLLLVNVYAKSFFSNDTQADNSKYIGALKDLVISTQKTRGLTNTYLNGDTVALLLVQKNKQDMKEAIGKMEASNLSADPVINTRATAISQALVKLNRKALKMKPAKAFESYTEQIDQVLMLAQTVSRRNSKDLNPLGQEASSMMMEIILPMTEYIGRMRGKGAGLAAKAAVSAEQNLQVLSMISEIEDLQKQLQAKMQSLLAKYPDSFNTTINTMMGSIDNTTKAYVKLTKTVLLRTPDKVNATDYFDQGTDLITLLIKLYDDNNRAILKDSEGWI